MADMSGAGGGLISVPAAGAWIAGLGCPHAIAATVQTITVASADPALIET
jgi:hypothetical protein